MKQNGGYTVGYQGAQPLYYYIALFTWHEYLIKEINRAYQPGKTEINSHYKNKNLIWCMLIGGIQL